AGSARKGREQKRLEADARQKRSEVKQELQQELRTLEEKILRLELRQKELTGFLEQPDRSESSVRPAQAGRELASVTQELKTLSLRWERLVDTVQEV
ncbi:MAG TPA: ABC transporter C-terminal domain-containing protein, partial [Chthoniobacterales bacterium]|nr:ABC transporter C-terminal domain-containing protein [Chthoniobacterales bacterium]